MDNDSLLAAVRALRQDVETQTAVNIVTGINTAETMALLGHWMRHQRVPTDREARDLEKLARKRWTEQVRQAVALARREPGGLDESLSLLLGTLGGTPPEASSAPKARRSARPAAKPASRRRAAAKPQRKR